MSRSERSDGPLMSCYRVTFVHVRHRTRFELVVNAPEIRTAELAATQILRHKVGGSAAMLTDWRHLETEQIEPVGATRDGCEEKT